MKIVYKKQLDRSPTDVRFVAEDYVPIADEEVITGDALPSFPKTSIELAEVEATKVATEAEKSDIAINFPSWETIDTRITNIATLADVRKFLIGLARVVWRLGQNRLKELQ